MNSTIFRIFLLLSLELVRALVLGLGDARERGRDHVAVLFRLLSTWRAFCRFCSSSSVEAEGRTYHCGQSGDSGPERSAFRDCRSERVVR